MVLLNISNPFIELKKEVSWIPNTEKRQQVGMMVLCLRWALANSEKTAPGSGTGPSQSKDLKGSADYGAAHLSLASVGPQILEPACHSFSGTETELESLVLLQPSPAHPQPYAMNPHNGLLNKVILYMCVYT